MMMPKTLYNKISSDLRWGLLLSTLVLLLASCSETKNIPDGDRLYTGLKHIKYSNYEKGDYFTETQKEIEAALATEPNGSLFGSSYHRNPFAYGLRVWNAYSGKDSKTAKWITKTFGQTPVLINWVNPELRSSVAQAVLRNHGYFDGKVTHEIIDEKNPKKTKIAYYVEMNHLYTLDSIRYVGFPTVGQALIDSTMQEAEIAKGDPFNVASLNSERSRIATLFRNNGYYYYQSDYASYLADTLQVPGKVQLNLQMAQDIPEKAKHKWYIGKVNVEIRKTFMERLQDSIHHRSLTIRFNGKKPPIRPRVIFNDLRIRPGVEYNYDNYLYTANKINSTGSFSMTDLQFVPRDTTSSCDTLDFTLNCVLDKPYDVYVETNYISKNTGRNGPQLVLGFAKRNAFRGGEKLSVNLNGSYEWQSGKGISGLFNPSNSETTYEYGWDATLELPRLVNPFRDSHKRPKPGERRKKRKPYYSTPSTYIKAASDVINRAGYFRMHSVSGELTYRWQPTATLQHEFTPLGIDYQFKNSTSAAFDSICLVNPYLLVTMQDQFITRMKYTITYTSPTNYRNPIYASLSVSESANLLSLGYMAFGKKWNDKEKKLFNNPYAQFVKIEGTFRKNWQLAEKKNLVAHINAGVIYSYGNSTNAPYLEQFYAGGANGVRAFQVRGIGPGSFYIGDNKYSYLFQTGDVKFLANLEYRCNLFGNLYGAAFLDAGNVWTLKNDDLRANSKISFRNFFDQLATGTGIGLRYDLEFLIVRLDWGIAIHCPYDTGRSGYFNVNKFSDCQCLHFAVGMPF